MADELVPVYAFGRVYRVPRSQAKPLLEQLDVPQPPCPAGWSRLDYGAGRAFGDECAVPATLRDASMYTAAIGFFLLLLLLVGQLHRRRAKGLTRTNMYHAISIGTNCTLMWVLWYTTGLLAFDSTA